MFDLRLVAYDPPGEGGALRGRVPRPPGVKWYSRIDEPPTLTFEWSEYGPAAEWLKQAPCEIAVQLYIDGEWVEPRDGRFELYTDAYERLADVNRMHRATAVGAVTLLERPKVWEDAAFLDATPGEVMGDLIAAAKDRGALATLSLGFTDTHDSNGEPWPTTLQRGFEVGTDLWQVLTNLVSGGLVGFWMQGRTLHMVAEQGQDLTTGTPPVYLRDVMLGESPESHDWRDVADTVILIGDEGHRWHKTNPEAVKPWGRTEKVLSVSGVTSEGAATLYMDAALAAGQDATRTLTRQWEHHGLVPWMPGRDMQIGDWILADTAVGTRQRLRIADMAVTADETSITAFVTLGTVRDEALVRMIKAQRARDGSNVIASGTPTPPPPINDGSQWPAAPTNITITAGTWTNDNGQTQGQVSASWDEVTTDTNGQPIQIKGYQLRGRRTSNPPTGWMDIWRAESSPGSGTKAEVGTGETWNFQLAAVSPTYSDASGVGDNTGPFAPVPAIVVTVQADTQAPGVPSAPTLSSTPGVLTVAWDGLTDSGQPMPPDFLHAVVELEGITTERPWTLSGAGELRIDAGRDEPIQIGGVHRARLKAVDRAGNESNWGNWSTFVAVRDRDIWPVQVPSVTATTSTVLGPDGRGVGVIHADWLAVATDTEGNPISISHYVVRVQQSGWLGWHEFRTNGNVTTADCSNPDFVVGSEWSVRVAAVHVNGNDNWTGAFSPPDTVTIGPDTVPPSVPSAPLVSSSMAGLTIAWDGLTSTGAQMPIDLDYLEAHITGRSEPVIIDKITRTKTIWDVTVGTSYEVRLRAVDYAGNVSALSAPASATVVSAITGLQAQIDQVELDFAAADLALQEQIDTVSAASADGKSTNFYGSTTPVVPTGGHKVGDTWFDTGAKTIKVWTGAAWVAHALSGAQVEAIAAAKVTGTLTGTQIADAAITGQHMAAGSVDVNKLADGSVSASKLSSTVSQSITDAQADADAAAVAAANAAGLAGTKADVLIQSAAPAAAMQKATTLWIDTTGGANTPKRWSGSAWVVVTDKVATDAAAAAAAAQSAATAAQATADGKSKVTYSTSVPGTATNKAGDLWFVRDGSGTVVSQWEGMGGTSWTQRTLANTVIANLDAGKITTGTLSANRIGTNTLTATHIAAGAIGTDELAANAVVAGKIAAAQITAGHMVAGTITAASGIIADAAIGTAKIQDAAVTNAKILTLDAAKITTGFLDAARIKADAAWVTGPLLIGNTDEVVVDPTWQNADLTAERTRSPWALVDAEWVKSSGAADDFMLAAKSAWSASDPACHMQLRSGVRYRIEATVFLTVAGNVGIVHRNASGGYGWVTGPVALAAFTSYQLVGEFTWGTSPGAFGIRFETSGYLSKVSVRPMLAQVLIQDGLISTPKLAANAVTADKIDAGAVTALKLSTDALDFKSATGMVLTSPTIQSHTEAFRGFKLTPTAFKLYSLDGLGTEWFSADSSGVRVAGDFQTTGQYPRLEIKRDLMGSTFSGIRWYPQAGWQSWPELKITSTAWGVDTPGSLYAVGGTRHNLTMHPELALRSGYMNGTEERYWPKADLLLGAGGTTYGRIRIEDLGLNTTAFSAYANFHDLFTPSRAQELLLNVPGSPGDIRIKSAAAGISLEVGNGWIRTQGIGTSTGGQDIRMEGNWRLVYQTSLSADKLDQERMGVRYELLDLKATSWIDRVRREEDPSWDVRYGGWIAEDVQAISEANGDSLAPALVHRGGELSGINDKAINALHLDITADVVRRLSRVEAAVERILDAA